MWVSWRRDALAAAVVAVTAFPGARAAFLSSPPQPFSQGEFAPAVMIAAGHGFSNTVPAAGGPLDRFLRLEAASLDRSAVDAAAAAPLDQFQQSHRYLMTAVGWWWRTTGISWSRLAEVAAAGHAAAAVAVFAIVRMFVPAGAALVAGLWFGLSPLQLTHAPHLRDFMKGPFVLAALALLVAIVFHAASRRRLVGLAAALGAVIGVGLGFRMDVVIMAPIGAAVIVFFTAERPWRGVWDKALAVFALAAALTVAAWPVVTRLSSGGSNGFHVILLGYADGFNPRLGVEPTSYSLLPYYSDDYLRQLVRVRSAISSGVDASMPSAAYDRAGMALWIEWLRHAPADAVTRVFASAIRVLDLGFDGTAPGSAWIGERLAAPFFALASRLSGLGWAVGGLLVAASAAQGPATLLCAMFLLLALAGYPSLQFDPRHYFHLQALPIAVLVVAVTIALRRARTMTPLTAWRSRAVQMARATAPAALAIGLLLIASRAYQVRHLQGVFQEFLPKPSAVPDLDETQASDGRWVIRWPHMAGLPTGVDGLEAAYYVAEFRVDAGAAAAIALRYTEGPDQPPCALLQSLVTGPGIARFGFPVASSAGEGGFDGIEVGPEMRARLVGISRTAMGPQGLPILMRLAADWPHRRLFQRLSVEERWRADDVSVGMFGPADRCGSRLMDVDATLDPVLEPRPALLAGATRDGVRVVPGSGLEVNLDRVEANDLLARFERVPLDEGDRLVVRLTIARGAVAVALDEGGSTATRVDVPRPGTSVVTMPVRRAGRYSLVLTSGPSGLVPAVSARVDRVGVLRGPRAAVPLGGVEAPASS